MNTRQKTKTDLDEIRFRSITSGCAALRLLAEVFQKIYEKCEGKQTIDPKSPAEALKKYFVEVLPEYDRSRVHVSDMKKMATWYNLLVASGMTEFKTGNEESQEESGENGQQS